MTRSLLCLALLSLAVQAGAQVYKTVGPDGKVTYSDHPPLESRAQSRVQVLRNGKLHEVDEPAPLPRPAGARAPGRAPDAGLPGHPAAAENRAAAFAPAIGIVFGNVVLLREVTAMCSQVQPDASRRYQQAREGWTARNQAVIARTEALVARHFGNGERSRFEEAALEPAQQMKLQLSFGSIGNQRAACERFSGMFASSQSDLAAIEPVARLMRSSF